MPLISCRKPKHKATQTRYLPRVGKAIETTKRPRGAACSAQYHKNWTCSRQTQFSTMGAVQFLVIAFLALVSSARGAVDVDERVLPKTLS
jgi:hypothetical protein